MEDPVRFDVFGIIRSGMSQAAADFMVLEGTFKSRREALVAANRSVQSEAPTLLLRSVTWSVARDVGERLAWAEGVVNCQEGYTPDSGRDYCETHNFQYGGIFGCHVCSGFYEP